MENKKVAFITLGCKVNQYETNAMCEKFINKGYEVVEKEEKADIYIVNTCTVTNMSDRKSRQMLRRVKEINEKAIIVACGCYAQVAKEELEKIDEIDIVLGNNEKKNIVDYVEKYIKENNKEPTIEEIAQEMNITVSKAKELYRLQNDTISLNKLVNHDDDTELESILKTSDYMNPEKLAVAKTMREQVRKELENSSLSEREKEVLILKFGLYDQEPLTQTEIAKKFDVSRGAISQIKQRALKKLGNSKNIKILAMYMISSEKAVEQLKELDKKSLKKNKEDNISIEKVENLKMSRKTSRKLKTLYEFFKGYSKEEVDSELEKLTEEEKRIIVARFGENLNVLIPDSLDKEQKNKFYRTIVPRIKRHLSEQKVTKELETNEKIKETYSNNTETEEENSTLIDIPSVDNKDVSLEEPIFLNQKETPIIKTSNEETNYVGNSVIEKNSSKQEEIITKDDYIKLLELLKTPMFNQITGTLTNKELVIISLKLGYIDGKYFSNESIAEFLGIEKDEIIETTKKILLLYKERLNELIDNAIEVVTEKPSTLTRKLKNI